jgi:hypothetical protein
MRTFDGLSELDAAVGRVTVELESSDKPVCVAETVALLVPGTPEEKE